MCQDVEEPPSMFIAPRKWAATADSLKVPNLKRARLESIRRIFVHSDARECRTEQAH